MPLLQRSHAKGSCPYRLRGLQGYLNHDPEQVKERTA